MKLLQNQEPVLQAITAYDEKSVMINNTCYLRSLLVLPDRTPVLWSVPDFDNLDLEDFSAVFAAQPELLVIGTGMRQRFLPQKLLARLSSGKIGIECMNNPAACRTFNLLISEGRRVALALFMEDSA